MTTAHESEYFRALLARAAVEDRALTVSGASAAPGPGTVSRIDRKGAPMSSYSPISVPASRPVLVEDLPPAPVCSCGATLAPDGTCLEVGSCVHADERATRAAARSTAKYAVAPAAWNARGYVD